EDRIGDGNTRFPRRLVGRRVKDRCRPLLGGGSVDRQLVKHLSGQVLLPEIAVLGVEDGRLAWTSKHHEVRARGGSPAATRVEAGGELHHAPKPEFVPDRVLGEVLTEEPG